MNKLIRSICFSLIIGLLVSYSNCWAAEKNSNYAESSYCEEDSFLDSAIEKFNEMTIDELNDYIDSKSNDSANSSLMSDDQGDAEAGTESINNNAKLAWLAFASIARKKGYPCSATLIECSVKNRNYSEGINGSFGKKIKNTAPHKNALKKAKKSKKKKYSSSTAFEKKDSKDLYYSLHNVNYSFLKIKTGHLPATYTVTYSDTYDFAYKGQYKDMLTTLANNAGWLSQHMGVLHPIKVKITFPC